MKDLIVTITFVLLSFSLTSAKQTNVDPKTKEMQTEGMQTDTNTSRGQNDQDNMNSVNLMEIMNECNDSFRTDMSFIQSLDDSGSFPDETDRTPKCYVRCVLEKSEVASADGVYDAARAGTVFAGERGGKVMTDVEDLARSCAMRNEQCKCERAYQFMKCLMEKEIAEYEKAE